MSNVLENGPSNLNGDTEQVWERPWTLEEMQKSSTNWSLAADSGLLLFLQDFSQRMLSKTHEIEKQLDGLIRDTKATDSCLHTVFNDFLMLSNTQFIENRVYDEEVEEPTPKPETTEKQPEQEKTREQKEAELIPKVQEAVNYGLKVLESAFEQLDIKAGNSESEDEEALEKVEPILEAKDLYVDRPLPYLIGSQAFMDQDDVGLGDLSSDEMSIDSERDSVIESEDGEAESDEDFDQDEEVHGHFKKKASVVSYDDADEENEDDEDSDIFGGSDKDEDELKKDSGLPSFADELAARIKGETPSKPVSDRTSMSSGPSISQKKSKTKKETKPQVEDDQDEMFKPPDMDDEEYSPFGGKGGLFSGGKGLFDDDDEGDLFSEAPKNEHAGKKQIITQTAEPTKTKKIPTGAVSIFPENDLFGSPNDSNSSESKDDKLSPVKPKVQPPPKHSPVGGGLFDDEDDDDDFFSGKSLQKSTSAGQEKQMPKKTLDLFGEAEEDDDEDGTMFSGKSSAVYPQQHKRPEGEEETRPPEKKPPAGAISMFGPGTKNIIVECLKKRKPSVSEESTKSEESVLPTETVKSSPVLEASVKAQSKSLFSDDEDSQIFPNATKSKSKPTTQNKPSKAPLSLFDDEEEEDLFSSTPKPKSVQVKKQSLQPKKPVSSGLFSDDEDQWMSSKPSMDSPEVKPGGMKSSVSAPSRLPSTKPPQKDSLFDENDDDDLFAATKESSKKSSHRVSLLFEHDDDEEEDKEPLFGFKPPAIKTPYEPKTSAAPTLPEPSEEETVPSVAIAKLAGEKLSVEKTPVESVPAPDDKTEIKKKPAGAVSLFGGIDILGNKQDTSKNNSQEEISDGEDLHKEGPPPMEKKGPKAKKTALSLFDDDDDDDEDLGEIVPAPKTSKPAEKNTLKDPGPRIKSTGVFQDEELLFSHTQQRDNDPDVDLFATPAKPAVASRSSVNPVAPTLFGDDDDDDLFSSSKPKAPPKVPEKPSKPKKDDLDKSTKTSDKKVPEKPSKPKKDDLDKSVLTSDKDPTSPIKSKKTSSRIGELQASLAVNPASLLPGAVPRIPGAVTVIPGLAPSSFPAAARPLPAADTILDRQTSSEGGVSFDSPAQVNTLENANKSRVKGAGRRRPQTRAARQMAAQQSEESIGQVQHDSSSSQAQEADMAASIPTFDPVSLRPSALTIPVVTTPAAAKTPDEAVRPKRLLDAEEDLFDSDDLFATASLTKPHSSSKHKTKSPEEGQRKGFKTEPVTATKKDQSSIFDNYGDDLFAVVKQKPVQKAKPLTFLDEDDDDIFGAGKSKEKAKTEIVFQDEVKQQPKSQKKPKDVSLDASLFDDDDVDIFADLTDTTKPKEKKAKKKVETKSIFDDDMDDIFSTGTSKPTVKPSSKSKKNQPAQDTSSAAETGPNIFDDPLNVFGGN